MITAIGFVVAAGLGALGRAEAGRRSNRRGGFALGTLTVNVTGSFLLGLLANATPPAVTVLGVAGLGAYTTFSSFAHDVVALIETRQPLVAGLYVVATYALGITAAATGVAIAG